MVAPPWHLMSPSGVIHIVRDETSLKALAEREPEAGRRPAKSAEEAGGSKWFQGDPCAASASKELAAVRAAYMAATS